MPPRRVNNTTLTKATAALLQAAATPTPAPAPPVITSVPSVKPATVEYQPLNEPIGGANWKGRTEHPPIRKGRRASQGEPGEVRLSVGCRQPPDLRRLTTPP